MEITKNTIEEQKTFKPFNITIKIENEREAIMLQALTNSTPLLCTFINNSGFKQAPSNYTHTEVTSFTCIWNTIHDHLKETV